MNFEKISSRQNPHVRRLAELRERAARTESGLFLLEGLRELERAAANGIEFVEFLFCPELVRNPLAEKIFASARERLAPSAIFELSRPAFEKISYRDRPEGVIAIARMREHTLATLPAFDEGKSSAAPLFLVAESVEKPGNLGTMLRSADASGASAVIVCDPCTDIHNPNVVRASTGTLFTLPVAVATAQETIAWLKANNFGILAATPHAEKLYFEQDLTGRVALCLGSEQYGLTETFMKDAGLRVRIPMLGVADSLNVSAAGNILLSEVVRQRILAGTVTPPPAEPWHGEGTHDQ